MTDSSKQLNASLRYLAIEFLELHGEAMVDVLNPSVFSSSISFIFYKQQHKNLLQFSEIYDFKQKIASNSHLWDSINYFNFPIQLVVSEDTDYNISSLILTSNLNHPPKTHKGYQVAAFTRPYPGYKANGDGYWFHIEQEQLFLCVVDGLGHGEAAEFAQQIAIQTVKDNFQQSIENLFAKTHCALSATRGVAMTVAKINLESKIIEHAGVGNVELRLYPNDSYFVPKAGVVGMGCWQSPRINHSTWSQSSILVLHSDGIESKWKLPPIQQLPPYSSQFLSHFLVRVFEREKDDSTALVVLGQ